MQHCNNLMPIGMLEEATNNTAPVIYNGRYMCIGDSLNNMTFAVAFKMCSLKRLSFKNVTLFDYVM